MDTVTGWIGNALPMLWFWTLGPQITAAVSSLCNLEVVGSSWVVVGKAGLEGDSLAPLPMEFCSLLVSGDVSKQPQGRTATSFHEALPHSSDHDILYQIRSWAKIHDSSLNCFLQVFYHSYEEQKIDAVHPKTLIENMDVIFIWQQQCWAACLPRTLGGFHGHVLVATAEDICLVYSWLHQKMQSLLALRLWGRCWGQFLVV